MNTTHCQQSPQDIPHSPEENETIYSRHLGVSGDTLAKNILSSKLFFENKWESQGMAAHACNSSAHF